MSRTNVTILGTGFGALTAIREFRKRQTDIALTVISPRDTFDYLPSSIWIPSRLRDPAELRVPLAAFFARNKVDFVHSAVDKLSEDGRVVTTADGREIANDGLIIASGGRYLKKLPGIEHSINPCGGLDNAVQIRDRLEAMEGGTIAVSFGGNPKEPSAVRGGPAFEFLFGIDKMLRRQKRRDRFRLVFFHALKDPGNRLGKTAVAGIQSMMRSRNIDMILGEKPKTFTASSVVTDGSQFDADLILFIPGMTGPAWLANTGLPLSEGGLIRADEYCRVEGLANTYVLGDSGSFPGPAWMPKQAHMADLQAAAAVENLIDNLLFDLPAGRAFKVELICIIDGLSQGALVFRSPSFTLLTPMTVLFHWAKRWFERHYLNQYR